MLCGEVPPFSSSLPCNHMTLEAIQAIADIDEHSNLTPPNPLPLCRPARPDRPPAGLQRTGPIPKAEKNTWKQKTKYRWSMDDGLLAKRTRRAANAKSFEKKRRSGGGYDDW